MLCFCFHSHCRLRLRRYDSILSMTLSLGAGDIDEMGLPEIVAQYVLSSRPDFKIFKTEDLKYKQYLAFGFMEKNEELCKKFNDALKDIKSDGSAAGFNTALLSEIAKKLKVNISLVYTNTGARADSLVSGRSDVVFWYQLSDGVDKQKNILQGVIVSEPYYEWDKYVYIMLKNENKK